MRCSTTPPRSKSAPHAPGAKPEPGARRGLASGGGSLARDRSAWVEREYWAIIKRLMPGVRALVGEESFGLLESGVKAETDAFRDVMVPMLRARLKRGPGG